MKFMLLLLFTFVKGFYHIYPPRWYQFSHAEVFVQISRGNLLTKGSLHKYFRMAELVTKFYIKIFTNIGKGDIIANNNKRPRSS